MKINEEKSSIVRPQKYEYLGYGFVSSYAKGSKGKYQLVVSKKSWEKLKQKIKYITRKTIPASFDERILSLRQLMYGWINYFKHANIHNKLKDIDSWVRSRLRYCIWHHWNRPKGVHEHQKKKIIG
ncbi:MAG: group II intron maturase-specific domain-containing protein [Bacteroidota bacterium]|nr:group II intron maturase-specific domain-containing protein [Bacteroidota bacterium]